MHKLFCLLLTVVPLFSWGQLDSILTSRSWKFVEMTRPMTPDQWRPVAQPKIYTFKEDGTLIISYEKSSVSYEKQWSCQDTLLTYSDIVMGSDHEFNLMLLEAYEDELFLTQYSMNNGTVYPSSGLKKHWVAAESAPADELVESVLSPLLSKYEWKVIGTRNGLQQPGEEKPPSKLTTYQFNQDGTVSGRQAPEGAPTLNWKAYNDSEYIEMGIDNAGDFLPIFAFRVVVIDEKHIEFHSAYPFDVRQEAEKGLIQVLEPLD